MWNHTCEHKCETFNVCVCACVRAGVCAGMCKLTISRQVLAGIGVDTCAHQVTFIIVISKVRCKVSEACL